MSGVSPQITLPRVAVASNPRTTDATATPSMAPDEPIEIVEPLALRVRHAEAAWQPFVHPSHGKSTAGIAALARGNAGLAAVAAGGSPATAPLADRDIWVKLDTVPYKGKQDAIDFVSPTVGWYGNGLGRVFKTEDGGTTWNKTFDRPGTYVRALGFIDEKTGFLGNIGKDYFPGVTDDHPLYRTDDGGSTWTPVKNVSGPAVKGICAIDVLRTPFINAGKLDYKITLRAAGRVGGPAFMMTSRDLGQSWTSEDLSKDTAMIMDVKFVSDQVGFIAGGSDPGIDSSHARILKTSDGGKTWRNVYESKRTWECTWKVDFPSKNVGYVTVMNYNPNGDGKRVVAKTTDGGETWTEIPLATDKAMQEFGVGFMDENHGWVGGMNHGMGTDDGGKTWTPVDIGQAANKFKIMSDGDNKIAFTVGVGVYKRVEPADRPTSANPT